MARDMALRNDGNVVQTLFSISGWAGRRGCRRIKKQAANASFAIQDDEIALLIQMSILCCIMIEAVILLERLPGFDIV